MGPQVEQEVRGAGVLKRIAANVAVAGHRAVDQAMQAIPSDVRTELQHLDALDWIELQRVEILQDAIAAHAGRDPEALHDEVIRRTVDDALHTLYRVALRFASEEWMVARTQAMFGKTRKIGRLVSRVPEPGSAELELSEWPGIRERYVRQVAIGVERVLVLTGRADVRVEHLRRMDGATIQVRWRTRS